ncbi:MAG: glycosyl hydrolase family 28 protein, partial [Saprospiraceae bacterium]
SLDRPHESLRPQLIEFDDCRQVRVTGITLRNSACWVQTYDRCDSLQIDSIRVESRAYWNNDGIDLVNCHNVHVHDCFINSADDGICLKSSNVASAFCENILVERCTIRSSASAFKIGTASYGGFRHIRIRDLTIQDTYRSAIAIEVVDGAFLEDVEVYNVRAMQTGNAIFIRLGNRRPQRGIGRLRDVYIHDVYVEVPVGRPDSGYAFPGPVVAEPHNLFPSSIVGLPGHPVQNVRLEHIHLVFGGAGSRERAYVSLDSLASIPERPGDYPEFSMFGELPAWGFYVRHVQGLKMKNVRLECIEPDFRPALVFDEVQGLVLRRVSVAGRGGKPVAVYRDSPGITGRKVKMKH